MATEIFELMYSGETAHLVCNLFSTPQWVEMHPSDGKFIVSMEVINPNGLDYVFVIDGRTILLGVGDPNYEIRDRMDWFFGNEPPLCHLRQYSVRYPGGVVPNDSHIIEFWRSGPRVHVDKGDNL